MGAVGSIFSESMSQNQHQEVIESWEEIRNNYGPENLGKKVFQKLFEQYPDTRLLFKTFGEDENWETSRGFLFHSKTVVSMIGSSVVNVKKNDNQQSLFTVGKAHQFFGLKKCHFDLIGKELIIALEEILGEKMTPYVKKSWMSGYDLVSKVMLESMTNSKSIH